MSLPGRLSGGKSPEWDEMTICAFQKDFVIKQQMLYLKTTPPNTEEEVFAFIIPCIK